MLGRNVITLLALIGMTWLFERSVGGPVGSGDIVCLPTLVACTHLRWAGAATPPKACLSSEFICTTSGTCLASSKRCNGVVDCNDGSDENCCKFLYLTEHESECLEMSDFFS